MKLFLIDVKWDLLYFFEDIILFISCAEIKLLLERSEIKFISVDVALIDLFLKNIILSSNSRRPFIWSLYKNNFKIIQKKRKPSTEINITSPTGIVEINGLENIKVEKIFWDLIKKKL